jgi:hypothetical protein
MRKIPHRSLVRHDLFDLPLFKWSVGRAEPCVTIGGQWIHRRSGLSPAIANTVAELAGIGPR